jgi:hypothetical protein
MMVAGAVRFRPMLQVSLNHKQRRFIMAGKTSNYKFDPFFDIKIEDVKTTESGLLVPRKAILDAKTDQVISVVSNRYKIIPNRELVNQFETYLAESDINFKRTGAGCNLTGSKMWANYRFPDIKADLGEYDRGYGKIHEDIELTMDLWGGYAPGTSTGFMIGGLALACMNGLMTKEAFYKWSESHVGSELDDLLNSFVLAFDTAKTVFQEKLVGSWQELMTVDFDKIQAANVLRSMELSKMYRDKMGCLYQQNLKEENLKTMWDFYQMVTWFTTHCMENRNRHLAMKLNAGVSEQLMGGSI